MMGKIIEKGLKDGTIKNLIKDLDLGDFAKDLGLENLEKYINDIKEIMLKLEDRNKVYLNAVLYQNTKIRDVELLLNEMKMQMDIIIENNKKITIG